MKKLLLYLPLLLLMTNCKTNLSLISAEKQQIIQGHKNATPYTNYQFKIDLKNDAIINIDSIKVFDTNNCYIVDYTISNKTSGKYTKQITTKGLYTIDIAMQKEKYKLLKNCNTTDNKVIVYYQQQTKKELIITDFQQKTIRKR